MKPDQLQEKIPAYLGDVDPADFGQDEQRRFEPPNRAKPKWPRHGLPLPIIMEPCSPVVGATVQLVGSGAGRRRPGAANPTYSGLSQRPQNATIKTHTRVDFGRASRFPGPDGQLPRVGTQFEPDPYEHDLPRKIDPGHCMRLPARNDRLDLIRSSDAALMDTVARLQLDMEEMKAGSRCHRTPGGRTSSSRPRQVVFAKVDRWCLLRCRGLETISTGV